MGKSEHEKILELAGLSKDPFTAEQQLLSGKYGPVTNEILRAIFFLKKLVIFEAFGYIEGDGN